MQRIALAHSSNLLDVILCVRYPTSGGLAILSGTYTLLIVHMVSQLCWLWPTGYIDWTQRNHRTRSLYYRLGIRGCRCHYTSQLTPDSEPHQLVDLGRLGWHPYSTYVSITVV